MAVGAQAEPDPQAAGSRAEPDPQAANDAGSLVTPFAGWLVKPEWADRVVSRAHDNLTAAERRSIAEGNPYSYVNVTRSYEDISADGAISTEDLVAHGASALARLLDAEVFAPTGRPALYLYRLTHDSGAQTGVVCTVAVRGISDGRVLFHENVREAHADLLAEHLLHVGAASNPVALAVKTGSTAPRVATDEAARTDADALRQSRAAQADNGLVAAMDEITAASSADLVFGSSSVRHEVWTVPADATETLLALLEHEVLYVTDGHHRLTAAQRAAAGEPGDRALARVLAVVYPAEQLHVEAFHRIAIPPNTAAPSECLSAIAEAVESMEPVNNARDARPLERGQVGVYAGGSGIWHRLRLPTAPEGCGAVDALDVELLRKHVLDPVLGADELGGRGTVDYLPEPVGIPELVNRCDDENRIGFVMHPVSVNELTAVADQNAKMPPKSSFFSPKPHSGAFMHMVGRGATSHLEPS